MLKQPKYKSANRYRISCILWFRPPPHAVDRFIRADRSPAASGKKLGREDDPLKRRSL